MNKAFYADLAERAVRTFLQATLAVIAADLANVTSVDAAKTVLIAAVAAGLSAVMSLIGRNFGPPDDPSVVPVVASEGSAPVVPPADDPNQPRLPDAGWD